MLRMEDQMKVLTPTESGPARILEEILSKTVLNEKGKNRAEND
jgi:hypothetical protein